MTDLATDSEEEEVLTGELPDTLSSLVTTTTYTFCGRSFLFHSIHNGNARAYHLNSSPRHNTAYICRNYLLSVIIVIRIRRKVESTICKSCKFQHSYHWVEIYCFLHRLLNSFLCCNKNLTTSIGPQNIRHT